eukprot:gene14177-15656_t
MSRYSSQYGNEREDDRYNRPRKYNQFEARPSGYVADVGYDDYYGRGDGSGSQNFGAYDRRGGGGGSNSIAFQAVNFLGKTFLTKIYDHELQPEPQSTTTLIPAGYSGQNYNRDGRQMNRGRDSRRNSGSGSYSAGGFNSYRPASSQHAISGGLLGASPNESAPKPQGGIVGNVTQQQQKALAAIQAQRAQNLLAAALQATNVGQQVPASLLPTPGNRAGNRPRQQQATKRRTQQRHDQYQGGKRRRDDQPVQRQSNNQDQRRRTRWGPEKKEPSKERKRKSAEGEEDDVYDIIDDESMYQAADLEGVEIEPELIEKVEELRKRTKVDRNIADQDVDKLTVFHFDGQNYKCGLCKIVAKVYKSTKQHFMGKRHSLNVIEARQAGNDVDRDIMDIMLHPENWLELNPVAKTILKKQTLGFLEGKRREEEEYRAKHPENYVTYRLDTRKSARKDGDTVIITSVYEANVAIKGFDAEKQIYGCESIKATSSFHCQLCNKTMHNGEHVVNHIRTEEHMTNYKKQLDKVGDYHDKLVQKNREITNTLEQHEGREVIFYEAFEETSERQMAIKKIYIKQDDPEFVRIEKQMPHEMHSGNEEGIAEEDIAEEEQQAEGVGNETKVEEGEIEDEEHVSGDRLNQEDNHIEEHNEEDYVVNEEYNYEEDDAQEWEEMTEEESHIGQPVVDSNSQNDVEGDKPMEEEEGEIQEEYVPEMEEEKEEEPEEGELSNDDGDELYKPSEPTVDEQRRELEKEKKPKKAGKKSKGNVQVTKKEDPEFIKPAALKKKGISGLQKAAKAASRKVVQAQIAKGRAGKPLARSSRGARAGSTRSPRLSKAKLNASTAENDHEESFEFVEVSSGEEQNIESM